MLTSNAISGIRNKAKNLIAASFMVFAVGACSPAAKPPALSGSELAADSSTESPARFPLDNYLGLVWGTSLSPEIQKRMQEEIRQRSEALITQCMHDAGFEYDPENIPGVSFGGTFSSQELHPNDREWVAQWGYGVVRGAELVIFPVEGTQTAAHTLSAAELDAFHRALSGPPCEEWGVVTQSGQGASICNVPDGWSARELAEVSGCQGQASLRISDESLQGLEESEEFAPLFDAIATMRSQLRSEVGGWETDWAACMANSGFPGFERRVDPTSPWPSAPETQIRDEWRPIGTIVQHSAEDTASMLEREINLALADFDCRAEVDYEARENFRRTEAELQFIDDNHAALEALRLAAEQRS